MIRLGLRLAVAGGREAVARLALIAVAVATGVVLLLTTLAAIHAVGAQNARYAWLETAYTGSNAPAVTSAADQVDPLWWYLRADHVRGEVIGRVDLAATGPESPVPPGLSRLPADGEYYASPALAALLRSTPADQLADRYPGRLAGVIGPAALPAPDSLIVVVGRSAADLSQQPRVAQVARISSTPPSQCAGECALGVGVDANGITLVLTVVTAALVFPVLVFIGGATRLSAARREQRFAAMRLVGATPRQIAVIAAVESAVASAVGALLGAVGFAALRPLVARIPFTGARFFPGDLTPRGVDLLLVCVGIPLAAAVVARLALRRVSISPLGVTRRARRHPPRSWRVLPLVAGLGWLGWLAYGSDIGSSDDTSLQANAYLAGVLTVMGGLVLAGPWLTMAASRLVARRATRPATLIAARRLADDPQTAFRAISGLVLAVFIGTGTLAVISTIVASNGGGREESALTAATLVDVFRSDETRDRVTALPAATEVALAAVPGVRGVAVVRVTDAPANGGFPPRVVLCAELAGIPALGSCPAGTVTALVDPDYGGGVIDSSSMTDTVWPAAAMSPAELAGLAIDSVVVGTDGTTAAVERSRTVLSGAVVQAFGPQTMAEIQADGTRLVTDYQRLADVVLLTSLPIAGCSLAVGVAGGLAERRRPFSLLRLTGVPLGLLRRVVALEAAVPLLLTAAVSAGAGLLSAQLFLRAQLHQTVQPPGPGYYALLLVGLLASLGVLASTMPLLARTTGPEAARND